MKLTKATLKRLIKEELTKEARNLGRPPISSLQGGYHYNINAPSEEEREAKQMELIDKAMDFGAMMSGEVEGLDINDRDQIGLAVSRLSKEFKKLINEILQFQEYLSKSSYFLDDEDYSFEDPSSQQSLDHRRRSYYSPKQRKDLEESRRRRARRK
jgi:hypothetical protein